jgi:hypothetical protein
MYYDYLFPQKFDNCGLTIDEIPEGGSFRCYSDSSFSYTSNISPTCNYTTSIFSINMDIEDIKIFPVPSNGCIIVDVNPNFEIHKIIVYDLSGKIVLNPAIKQNRFPINELAEGSYIISLTDKNMRTLNKKIIVH